MAIERAETLYPKNSTVVESGTPDVRLLSATNGGTNETQTCTATHLNDNVERTFNAAKLAVNNVNNANTTLTNKGWALRLANDMTPTSVSLCDCVLTAGTLTVQIDVTLTVAASGVDAGGTQTPTWRASLWDYLHTTDTATVIASGSNAGTSWSTVPATGDQGTFKTVSISVPLAANYVFGDDSELYLQIGFNTGTLTNPATGTNTYTFTLRTDDAATKIAFVSGQHLYQFCAVTTDMACKGVVTRGGLQTAIARALAGKGEVTSTKVAAVAKTFNLAAKGEVTSTKTVQASRTFDLSAKGEVTGRIEIPIDEVPSGGGGTTVRPVFAQTE